MSNLARKEPDMEVEAPPMPTAAPAPADAGSGPFRASQSTPSANSRVPALPSSARARTAVSPRLT